MRVLFDEGVPWPLRRYLPGHEAWTVAYMGWNGRNNGELLSLAKDEFDVLITVDQGIPCQQNISELDVAVIVLAARTNGMNDLRPLVTELVNHLYTIKGGQIVRIDAR